MTSKRQQIGRIRRQLDDAGVREHGDTPRDAVNSIITVKITRITVVTRR
jgi:hypothetical protein